MSVFPSTYSRIHFYRVKGYSQICQPYNINEKLFNFCELKRNSLVSHPLITYTGIEIREHPPSLKESIHIIYIGIMK